MVDPTPIQTASTGSRGRDGNTVGGGSGQGGGSLTHDMVVHMISTSEQKTISKIELIEANINRRLEKLDHMPSTGTIWRAAWSAAATILGIGLAVLAIGGDRFDGGVGLGAAIGDKFSENKIEINENRLRDEDTRENVNRILEKLENLTKRLDGESDNR